MTRPGLTYWRCPECGERVGLTAGQVGAHRLLRFLLAEDPSCAYDAWWLLSDDYHDHAEQLVEAHEARHGIGAA